MIRPVTIADSAAIAAIYNPYIRDTIITFEEVEIDAEEIRLRIETITRSWPWLVAETDGKVTGYAYAGPWRTRSAYRHTVELGIYIDAPWQGRGIGFVLYKALIDQLRPLGVHRALGSISVPNPHSIALHEKLGFTKVAHFSEAGLKFGQWIDVGFWELKL